VILAARLPAVGVPARVHGRADGENATLPELKLRELCTVVPLLALSLFLGSTRSRCSTASSRR
jgi:hypothetical protein